MTADAPDERHYPYPAPIDAYGNGGFRFAEMSHRGSLLCLPSGLWAWPVSNSGDISLAAFERVIAEANDIDSLLIGTGRATWIMPDSLRQPFRQRGIAVDAMQTGPAIRTYNIMIGEKRRVAAALIAVA